MQSIRLLALVHRLPPCHPAETGTNLQLQSMYKPLVIKNPFRVMNSRGEKRYNPQAQAYLVLKKTFVLLFLLYFDRETKGLEGGVSSLETKAEIMRGGVKFR